QEFTAPISGDYKLEVWGAAGGNSYKDPIHSGYTNTVYGGKGGYCSGIITLFPNSDIYIYVGQSGEGVIERTFNGGGIGSDKYNSKSGGGATDVRLVNGIWNNFNSLKSRIMVAAGGGGAQHYYEGCNGGNAGGLSGQDGSYSISLSNPNPFSVATGATQTSGGIGGKGDINGFNGTFGIGGNSVSNHGSDSGSIEGSGGGGGYYGGGGAFFQTYYVVGSGSGGSSFISGYTGCDAIDESSTEDNIVHTGQPNHYSGKVFTNSVMIAGNASMPKPGGGTETGHTGNGYCIITWQQLP
ncbi:glycine rich domain-containing protein, partial [Segatella albensis]